MLRVFWGKTMIFGSHSFRLICKVDFPLFISSHAYAKLSYDASRKNWRNPKSVFINFRFEQSKMNAYPTHVVTLSLWLNVWFKGVHVTYNYNIMFWKLSFFKKVNNIKASLRSSLRLYKSRFIKHFHELTPYRIFFSMKRYMNWSNNGENLQSRVWPITLTFWRQS